MLGPIGSIVRSGRLEWSLFRWRTLSTFRKTLTVATKQGRFRVRTGGMESIGRSLYCKGHYEFDFFSRALQFLRTSGLCLPRGEGTILDVGANIGVISIGALHNGEFERAVAVEPEPVNFSLMTGNVTLNGLGGRMVSLPYALGSENGEIQLELSENNFGDHRVRTASDAPPAAKELFGESARQVIRVRAIPLDSMVEELPAAYAESIRLVWIDVQGYEGTVFQGARRLLSRGIPVVSEIWPYGMERAGMSKERFCTLAGSVWKSYSVLRKDRFIRYPIEILDLFFDELGPHGPHGNVVFM
jgi:FkbM family methyltransferase